MTLTAEHTTRSRAALTPQPGELWLVKATGCSDPVAAIRSREADRWTAVSTDGVLTVLTTVTPLRRIPGAPVPADAAWDERVELLRGFARPWVGTR